MRRIVHPHDFTSLQILDERFGYDGENSMFEHVPEDLRKYYEPVKFAERWPKYSGFLKNSTLYGYKCPNCNCYFRPMWGSKEFRSHISNINNGLGCSIKPVAPKSSSVQKAKSF